jgi:D-beta-D-heptose 7-phosphate kinase/D-beta-D-heptose 1-phosphate adenosyltransferase
LKDNNNASFITYFSPFNTKIKAMSRIKHEALMDNFSKLKVLVIGDLLIDVYMKGESFRLSPEGPVPVVNISAQEEIPGGAANVAVNLRTLGAQVSFLSLAGDDENADKACSFMQRSGINCDAIVREPGRTTVTKTRLISNGHLISRFDCGSRNAASADSEQQMFDFLKENYASFDAILLGDYGTGLFTLTLIDFLQKMQQQSPRFLALDSKNLALFTPLNPSVVKPNYVEAINLLNLPGLVTEREAQLKNYGATLYRITGAEHIALTLDTEGALVFEKGNLIYHAQAHAVETPHVAGAGDTFISAFTLARCSGADAALAADLAIGAATVAIRKASTAPCYLSELKVFFSTQDKYVSDAQELEELCNFYRQQGKNVVFTNGCFDILHSGHVSYLNQSKNYGDVLIVGLNNDESIKRLKGSTRPINELTDRILVLSGLSSIDHIVPFGSAEDDTPSALIRAAKPQYYIKGGDYNLQNLPEANVVAEVGGQVAFIPLVPDHSTTNMIKRINADAKMLKVV